MGSATGKSLKALRSYDNSEGTDLSNWTVKTLERRILTKTGRGRRRNETADTDPTNPDHFPAAGRQSDIHPLDPDPNGETDPHPHTYPDTTSGPHIRQRR